jgi:di/tricarboxylate transporter
MTALTNSIAQHDRSVSLGQAARAIAVCVVVSILFVATGAPSQANAAVWVFVACAILWASLKASDLFIAVAGLSILGLIGAVDHSQLLTWLAHDTVWLIVAAFMISAVLKQTGLAEAFAIVVLKRVETVSGLFIATTLVVAATAFMIPSTSARAALFVPVFLALASAIGDARIVRALALLFPTTILLSAGASLTGAGAHLVAVNWADQNLGTGAMTFGGWLALAAPPTIMICAIASALIYFGFVPSEQRGAPLTLSSMEAKPLAPGARRAGWLALLATALWATYPMHGVDMAVTGLIVALAMTLPGATGVSTKAALKSVEWELVLFMAALLAISDALTNSAVFQSFGATANGAWPPAVEPQYLALGVAAAAMAAHFVIVSRTARIAIVLPAAALPAVLLGLDPVTATMLCALGTGFCQTQRVSAKPLTIFAAVDAPTFSGADLARLSAYLAAPVLTILWVAAALLWPWQMSIV